MLLRQAFIIFLTSLILSSNIAKAEAIIVYGNENKPPKAYIKNGKPHGILVDIVKYASKKMNIDIQVQLYPWKRAQFLAAKGEGGIIGFANTPSRSKTFEYSEYPMFIDEASLVTTKEKSIEINSIKDLNGKRLVQIRGASHGKEFEESINSVFELMEADSNKAILLMLLKGRADVAIINPGNKALKMIIDANEELHPYRESFIMLDKSLGLVPNYLAFAKQKNMTKLLKKFSQVMKEGYESGEIQKIIEQHY